MRWLERRVLSACHIHMALAASAGHNKNAIAKIVHQIVRRDESAEQLSEIGHHSMSALRFQLFHVALSGDTDNEPEAALHARLDT